MDLPYGAPYTLDQAFAFIQKDTILFGFPDILFRPSSAYCSLMKQLTVSEADIVLGLFKAQNPRKMDMVELDDSGKISGLDIKPRQTRLKYTWIIAAWTPAFTNFMHSHLKAREGTVAARSEGGGREIYVGDVIRAALEEGLQVHTVRFDDGDYLDIGTPEDLVQADAFVRNSLPTPLR
jgi:glucose-1-phosphate thymidylyltransferase